MQKDTSKHLWTSDANFFAKNLQIFLVIVTFILALVLISVTNTERIHTKQIVFTKFVKHEVKHVKRSYRRQLSLQKEQQTYIFTDNDSPIPENVHADHFINTFCADTHYRQGLCCKMAREYDIFMESEKRWFCHVDDDNYVNVPSLVGFLQQYNHSDNWYLGRPSISHPMEVLDRANPEQKLAFWFATGGAGFCISRGLADQMVPHAGGGRIMTTGDVIRLPDDCTVGYIINIDNNT